MLDMPGTFEYVGFWARVGASLIDTVLVAAITLPLLWVGIDAKKQGWHDKLAGTVVVRRLKNARDRTRVPVRFDG